MRFRWAMMTVLAAALTGAAHAQWGRSQLKVGDAAPSFNVERWVHGEEIAQLERGNVYLVEFWATWCAPCRRAIPWLSYLQKTYANDGLVVIGISEEDPRDIQRFISRNPGQIAYSVGADPDGYTMRAWMQAAGQRGLPTSFIVDRDGQIQYIGHPQGDHIETIIQLVLQGRYNARLFADVVPAIVATDSAMKVRNWRLALRHLDEIVEHDRHVFAMFNIAKFQVKIQHMGDAERAYAFARKKLEDYAGDAYFLADFAEHITTDPNIKDDERDLKLAMEAAKMAVAAGRENDPRLLSVLALVNFHSGNVNEAISLQRRAWMVAPPGRKPIFERALRDYQQAAQRAARREADGEPAASQR